MLVRLLYASRAASPMSEAELAAILKSSRAHNPAEGLTGLLCYSDGIFMQVLEGGRDAVNARYKSIIGDTRHRDVILLSYEEVAERHFAGWSMGQVNLSRLNPALVLKYCETTKLNPYAMSGQALKALFDELVNTGAIVCN
ncbi:BLUF domain-containing protein [Paucibacter sp. O1-1]|uniref:BLUF domain-containing protein n=1 Tax=Roseateles TaxID=93681 RepID=UPI0010F9E55A|nr:BLUF domain-containing protein [Paucibacter sp. M5-1]MCU7370688.1 BLUF domain-containing protein [Paucibacter sp. O1-1]MCZ7881581.1 BLUF domain-containing protein [Paucibacter sp. M5-1]MDA3825675.1 BLUF domain-containing protein [Paucibacter sp. O1-1]